MFSRRISSSFPPLELLRHMATKRKATAAVASRGKKVKPTIIDAPAAATVTADVSRCKWAVSKEMAKYHDEEWGVFQDDDTYLFEMLILEGAQAGLSWATILNKRDNYRKAFDGFDIHRVAAYDTKKMTALKEDAGIVRNRLKIKSAVANANSVLAIQAEFGSFSNYLWKVVNETREDQHRGGSERVPIISPDNARIISSPVSDALSKDLKRRGMTFCGTTIMYAFMQAVGLVNDHDVDCFRRNV